MLSSLLVIVSLSVVVAQDCVNVLDAASIKTIDLDSLKAGTGPTIVRPLIFENVTCIHCCFIP
jgi:hypothetical protein